MQRVKLSAWKIGDREFELHSDLQVTKKQNVSFPPTRKDSILWGRGSVLGLRRPGLEFLILCLEGSVISLIHLTILKEVLLAQFSVCAQRWPKTPFISFHFVTGVGLNMPQAQSTVAYAHIVRVITLVFHGSAWHIYMAQSMTDVITGPCRDLQPCQDNRRHQS